MQGLNILLLNRLLRDKRNVGLTRGRVSDLTLEKLILREAASGNF